MWVQDEQQCGSTVPAAVVGAQHLHQQHSCSGRSTAPAPALAVPPEQHQGVRHAGSTGSVYIVLCTHVTHVLWGPLAAGHTCLVGAPRHKAGYFAGVARTAASSYNVAVMYSSHS
mmetsp:Transcript_25777/g.56162  ORF Transcript_25777/g.56162 Transcript_25777/m.56162 type:complete len:115 (+) Transcript_25777:1685-2029(+)